MQKLTCNGLTWVDIQNPSKKDITALKRIHNLHPLVAEELLLPTYRPRIEMYDEQMFLVLHFPIRAKRGERHTSTHEIDFIIGKTYLTTTHYGEVAVLKKLYNKLTGNESLCKQNFGSNSGYILHYIISELFTMVLEELDKFAVEIEKVEALLQKKHNAEEIVEAISSLRYELLDYRKALKPQQTVLNSLKERGKIFFENHMGPYLSDITGEYVRVWDALENHKDTLEALNNTNESLLSSRSNEIMRRLTIMAFITFPLTLIASIFGMNTRWLPFAGNQNDFWIIFGIMIFGVLFMFGYFKSRHWL